MKNNIIQQISSCGKERQRKGRKEKERDIREEVKLKL
jgi:hypothetical protein